MFSHEENGPEPDWVLSEREQFTEFRDLNKDGKLDKDEIRHWILPQDYDHAQAEARHLVYESDKNKVFTFSWNRSLKGDSLHKIDSVCCFGDSIGPWPMRPRPYRRPSFLPYSRDLWTKPIPW